MRVPSFRLLISLYVAVLLAATSPSCPVYAEDFRILKTARGIYQAANLKDKLVISYDTPGLLVLSGPPIDLQSFTSASLNREDILHAFLQFDPRTNRYSSILVNGRDQYGIADNFSLQVGSQIRLNVDNSVPYASFVVTDSKERQGIVGVSGTEVIFSYGGSAAVRELEANTQSEYRSLIEPYTIKPEGLYIQGKKAPQRPLGVTFEKSRNPCLQRKSLFLTQADLRRLASTRDREKRIKGLERLIRKNDSTQLLDGLLPIRVSAEKVYAINSDDRELKLVQAIASKGLPLQICTVGDPEF